MINALSIDVEDYFQVEGFATVVDRADWEAFPSRVVENTRRVLALLASRDVEATFFMLGWVAERCPELVREIVAAGHEVASHGYWHQPVYRQTPEQFAEDVTESIRAIRDACPEARILGYRAPSFSIVDGSKWALKVLAGLGIKYDSSIFPIGGHDRYGVPNAPRFANRPHPRLCEFPPSTVRVMGRNWPVAGGGYFRLLPLRVTRWAIRRINAEHRPAVIYLHPWEFDADQPRIAGAPRFSRFRHYVNLGKTERRLASLLDQFQFAPMRAVFSELLAEADSAGPER